MVRQTEIVFISNTMEEIGMVLVDPVCEGEVNDSVF